MRKYSLVVLCLFFFVWVFFALQQHTLASGSNLRGDKDGEIQFSVISPDDAYPAPDRDWPIVHQETREYIDPKTGAHHVVTTVIREKPAGADEREVGPCLELLGASAKEATADAAPLATCTYEGSVSRSDVDSIFYSGQRLRHTLVSIAGKYTGTYEGSNKAYYKLTKLKNSWYRSNTEWTVQNANHEWGCIAGNCIKCDGAYYSGTIYGSVGTPAWYDDHYSWVYVSTPASPFPALLAEGYIEWIRPYAHALSDGYYSGVKRGTMEVSIEW